MPTVSNEEKFEMEDFSGGQQTRTTSFQRRANQVKFALNASFSYKIGGISKVLGHTQLGPAITTTTSSTTSSTSTSTSTSTTTSSTTSSSTSSSSTTTA